MNFLKIIPRKLKIQFLLIIIFLFISSFIEIIGIGFIPVFVGFLIEPEIFLQKINIEFLKDFFFELNKKELVIYSSFILCSIFIIKNIFLTFLVYFEGNFTKKLKIFNSEKLFKKYINTPYEYHLDKNPSTFVRSVTTDINQSANYVKNTTLIFKEVLVLIFIFTLLIYVDPKITTSIFIILGSLSFIFFLIIKNNLRKRGVINLSTNSNLLKISNQSFSAIKDVKLFGKEEYLTYLFKTNFSSLEKNHLLSYFLTSLPRFVLEIFAIIGISVVIIFLYFEDNSITNSLPLISLMAVSTIRLIPSFNSITKSLSSMKYNEASMYHVVSEIFDNKKVIKKSNLFLNKKFVNFKTNIELKNVSFAYENNKKKILDEINLNIKKNSKIAIVGKSGSGKTTIVDIIIGLLKPSDGYLLIDGIQLSELPNWNKKIGYIPQNFYLFDESIKRNVAFGIEEKNIDIDKVKRALEFAQLKEFVNNLDDGIETVVGNQGIMLSGGQKQRIIIARAAYNDPDILILDEATSAIDEEVEKEFINNLLKIGKNKTIIIISHRESTIKNCDKFFKIDNGKLNEIKKEKN